VRCPHLFIAVPIIEIGLFIQVGGALGLFPTLFIVIATAALGTWMLRQQGLKTMQSARNRLDAGQLPASEMVEGVLLLIGGAMLLTPGFMTDAFGFLCLLPFTRAWIAKRLGARMLVMAHPGGMPGGAAGGVAGAGTGTAANDAVGPDRRGSGTVIDGDYERLD